VAVEQIAMAHYRRQVALARRIADRLTRLWSAVDPNAIPASWLAMIPQAFAEVAAGQLAAAMSADAYLADLLGEYDLPASDAGRVNAGRLSGVASDGRALEGLLFEPAINTLSVIGQGASPVRALVAGRMNLDMIVRTQIADAGRVADGVALTAHRNLPGYVRLLNPPSCARCVILAGKRYRWNTGFQRHPRCDCRHVPSPEDAADDIRTDPRLYFDSLSRAEQDRVFTLAGAQAIRDGADIAGGQRAARCRRPVCRSWPADGGREGHVAFWPLAGAPGAAAGIRPGSVRHHRGHYDPGTRRRSSGGAADRAEDERFAVPGSSGATADAGIDLPRSPEGRPRRGDPPAAVARVPHLTTPGFGR
jgi:hypothetical protein